MAATSSSTSQHPAPPSPASPAPPPTPKRKKVAQGFFDFLKGRGADLGTPQENQQRVFVDREGYSAFLAGETPIDFQSSFVASARYSPKKRALEITYRDGHFSTYTSVAPDEAADFLRAESKGTWVHERLKVGYHQDRTWVHAKPHHPSKRIEDLLPGEYVAGPEDDSADGSAAGGGDAPGGNREGEQ